jgi:hypothetical protein
MADARGESASVPPSRKDGGPEGTGEDFQSVGPASGSGERDFGDSAGYGTGGSTLDYREVVGEDPVVEHRPNPLDAVMPSTTKGADHPADRQEAASRPGSRCAEGVPPTGATGARWSQSDGPQRTGLMAGLALIAVSLGLMVWSQRADRGLRAQRRADPGA